MGSRKGIVFVGILSILESPVTIKESCRLAHGSVVAREYGIPTVV